MGKILSDTLMGGRAADRPALENQGAGLGEGGVLWIRSLLHGASSVLSTRFCRRHPCLMGMLSIS